MAEGGEDIEMQDLSVREDVDDEETSLLGNRNLHRELLETKVDDYYNAVGMEPDVKDYNAFEFGKDNKSLFVKT
jgi:hypothetical protein